MYSHETSIYHAVVFTVIIIGFILGYVIYSLFLKHRRNVREQRKNFSSEINLLEKERGRVSRDIHDDAGSLIGLVLAHINEVKVQDAGDRAHIEDANALLEELTKRLKAIAVNLSPQILQKKGLEYTLHDYFERMQALFPLRIRFIYEVESRIGPEARIHIYRIIQEITNNTVKHAKAKQLKVHFRERNKMLYLLCRDDGIGFDLKGGQEESTGLGLASLKSRTEILEGKLKCTSNLKDGTEYFFAFPFEGTGENN